MTSLIWRLQEGSHDLIESASFPHFVNNDDCFNFEAYRDALCKKGEWPEKTRDCLSYSCEIKKKQRSSVISQLKRLSFGRSVKLDFFDFPGERIADAAIAGFESYEEWCDYLLKHYQTHSDYQLQIQPYLDQLGKIESGEVEATGAACTAAYRKALAEMIHAYKPLITPSTFVLDTNGRAAPSVPADELASRQYVGIDEHWQFCPLPASIRTAFPALLAEMRVNYEAYRKEIVLPLFKKITGSQILIILVDLPSTLRGGVDRFNDTRQIIYDLCQVMRPKTPLGKLLEKARFLLGTRLEKVAFIGSKADLIYREDISSNRSRNLIREITRSAQSVLGDVKAACFDVSAIKSTRDGSKPYTLIGRPLANNPEDAEHEFEVSQLPDSWPSDWAAGEYIFRQVRPEVPRNHCQPPADIGMDRIMRYLIN
jgi:uncharacterized protein